MVVEPIWKWVPEVSINKECIQLKVGVRNEVEHSTSDAMEVVFLATEANEVRIAPNFRFLHLFEINAQIANVIGVMIPIF